MKTNLLVREASAAPSGVAFSVPPASPLSAAVPANGWMPRNWRDESAGLIFLPRMLDKARRVLEGQRLGRSVMNGYLFGDFDYADRRLLTFLRTNGAWVLQLAREIPDEVQLASALVAGSRRSPREIAAWSRRFRVVNAPFLAMWDADEGRRAPGWSTTLLKHFYNRVLMPPVYLFFRAAQKLRPSAHDRYN